MRPVIALLLLVVLLLAPFVRLRTRSPAPPTPRQRLLHACLGDKRQVRRLVNLERAKQPGLSRQEAILRALDAIQRDNA
jgi:hypothetical protein